MTEKDIAVGVTAGPLVTGIVSKKPSYLIVLESLNGKSKEIVKFISADKPEYINNFIQVKGVFSSLNEEEIVKSFLEILANSSKESILEMLFPSHKICYIRNLVFRSK
jgi:hypothetical protein